MAHDSGDEPSCAVRMEHVHYLAVSHLFPSVILLEGPLGEQKQRLALEMKEQMIDREYDLMVRRQQGAGRTVP